MTETRFDVDAWSIGTQNGAGEHLAHEETVFGLANGHIGWRGNLDEGDPQGIPGSFLNGVFEQHQMPYAEEGYGYPEHGQSVINVPNGQILRVFVDDEPLDIRTGKVLAHHRRLDMQSGLLTRELEWESPVGQRIRLQSTRLMSFSHRSVAAVRLVVQALSDDVRVSVSSELLINEPVPTDHDEPDVREQLHAPFTPIEGVGHAAAACLVVQTRQSKIGVAVAMDHSVESSGSEPADIDTEASDDRARTTVHASLRAGERLTVIKMIGHEWSKESSFETLRDRAESAVQAAMHDGWGALVESQRARLEDFWACADVQIEGEPRLQQAIRFALFQVFQSSVRAEGRSVPGKGLTGSGYAGHTFWDFEGFVLPVLTSTSPEAARQALLWRYSTLDLARRRARQLHFKGAAFPWRTVDGREASGYWPASTAAFHINAAVAGAVIHYVRATGDHEFERDYGAEILVETARLWASIGRWDSKGGFHIDGVTGPDEYSAIANDNVYTNLAARMNLRGAVKAAREYPAVAKSLGVDEAEIAEWEAAAAAVVVVYDEERRVHPQYAGYTDLERWDFDKTSDDQYLLQENFPYFDIYRKQVVKQADLVLALYFAHEEFTPEEKARNFYYYEALTVRDSSLSAAVQSTIAAEVGHSELAYDYLAEVATLDLDDLHENTEEGVHIAALAGVWMAIIAGFGGMRDGQGGLSFRPQLPDRLTALSFGIRVHGNVLRVSVAPTGTTYELRDGEDVTIRHFDETVVLKAGVAVTLENRTITPAGPPPVQPRGRSPRSAREAFGVELESVSVSL